MLSIYETSIEIIQLLRPVLVAIERHDRDLARQLRRAAASVSLNISEGSGSRAGTRRERYANARGSARETESCLEVAKAFGYLDSIDPALRARLNRVQATLTVNIR